MVQSERLHPVRHVSTASLDTSASGIADSTISNGESLRLSQFPQPPSSIPTTPLRAEFAPPSPNIPTVRTIIAPLFLHQPTTSQTSPSLPSGSASTNYRLPASYSSPYSGSGTIYPHDWYDGASSVDVDDAEDRLLSTSFITSLLQEHLAPSPNSAGRRFSTGSDAFSGVSEMTYPPTSRYPDSVDRPSLPPPPSIPPRSPPPRKPQGARPQKQPPTSFASKVLPNSDYSDSLCSEQEDNLPTIIRSASFSRGVTVPGASVVGVAPATLRAISIHSDGCGSDYKQFVRSSSALPLTKPRLSLARPESRQSTHSNHSAAPPFFSRVSSTGKSIAQRIPTWSRTKPLPPVPIIPHIPIAAEVANRRKEAVIPLSDLAARAGTLNNMLEKGYYPHDSRTFYHFDSRTGVFSASNGSAIPTNGDPSQTHPNRKSQRGSIFHSLESSGSETTKSTLHFFRKKKLIIFAIFAAAALIIIGVAVGVTVGRKGQDAHHCAAGLAGTACNLNSTCVCTSSVTGSCDALAQNVVDLLPTMNELFDTDHTLNYVYTSLWLTLGTTTGSDCSGQSLLVDVAPALTMSDSPNRTEWAQAAILWNLVESQNVSSAKELQEFAKNAPWTGISQLDGPVPYDTGSFAVNASGFTFNFASQSISQPAVSFVTNGQPTDEQIGRLSDTTLSALNRMYSYALASSTQQQDALSTYWTSVLQQREEDLSVFLSLVSSSPLLIPFDATSQSVSALMTNSSTEPFPPPLGCYPNLSSSELEQISDIEVSVFGLSKKAGAFEFDTSCYPDRPLYGILNVLRLRLPFANTTTGVAQQAAVLNRDVGPRVVLRNGQLLSSLPGSPVQPSNGTQNPRHYGTLNHLQHVMHNYLLSLDIDVAIALVTFLLSYAVVPPDNESELVASLSSIPALEIAVFGSVFPADIDHSVSSFSTTSGTLFFGSEEGSALRNWTITGTGTKVIWADNATSALVVYDSSLTDETFDAVWSAAAAALESNVENVTANNVTSSLGSLGKMDS
ncbi:uncharacterized protein BT62DRAFT_1072492 [Guyanagaster necrorhizus]|uniref:Transmembrane protein n=1 Tax=Guyanagaster necrorhizus TaxID=856835 RepID=A0A9P8AWP8_9AGAR|nr:uncharacterized protein BT62DRAFT_1072492 [Guyanagaster necrorhizus MCA 3950]KAG7450411.1 hypothetical protein BT62DRAFT_1072492 [Guyanagaster necrorhizus MCA 3950]